MKKCVWYVSKYVTTPVSGTVGTRAFMLMRELARMGHASVIITSDSNHLAEAPNFAGASIDQLIDGVSVSWIRTFKYTGAKSVRRILSWLDFEWRLWRFPKDHLPKPDVVIVSSLSLLTIVNGLFLRARYGCRLIFEVRDIWPLTITEEGGFSRWNPFVMGLALVEKIAYRRADVIVGTMPNLIDHVEEVLGRRKAVECIPMGVDEALIDSPASVPADYIAAHIPQGKFIVCHAGTIGITNAIDTLIDCARSLQDRADIHFLILGDGGLKAHYQEACADMPNITFAPAVPRQMVQSVLAHCHLLYFSAHPSRVWRFGQSLNKVIDYMLAGKPIVASYTGFPSMINEAQCGTYVPASDFPALREELLKYAALPAEARAKVGGRGRAWLLEHRRYPHLAQRYLDIATDEAAHAPEGAAGGDRTGPRQPLSGASHV
jgi:glycosyltransferase involved in cell wall biosynthesis